MTEDVYVTEARALAAERYMPRFAEPSDRQIAQMNAFIVGYCAGREAEHEIARDLIKVSASALGSAQGRFDRLEATVKRARKAWAWWQMQGDTSWRLYAVVEDKDAHELPMGKSNSLYNRFERVALVPIDRQGEIV